MNYLIRKLEAYEIAFPDFTSIKDGIVNQINNYMDAFNKFYLEIGSYLPIELSDNQAKESNKKTISRQPPDNDTIEKLKAIAYEYMDVSMDLQAYIWDLQIALQNRLLGNLFDNRVAIRKPNDPKYKVLDIDK